MTLPLPWVFLQNIFDDFHGYFPLQLQPRPRLLQQAAIILKISCRQMPIIHLPVLSNLSWVIAQSPKAGSLLKLPKVILLLILLIIHRRVVAHWTSLEMLLQVLMCLLVLFVDWEVAGDVHFRVCGWEVDYVGSGHLLIVQLWEDVAGAGLLLVVGRDVIVGTTRCHRLPPHYHQLLLKYIPPTNFTLTLILHLQYPLIYQHIVLPLKCYIILSIKLTKEVLGLESIVLQLLRLVLGTWMLTRILLGSGG